MVFSVVVSRLRLPAIFALGLAGLRLCFYSKIRRQIVHTAWTRRRHRKSPQSTRPYALDPCLPVVLRS
jgi:hypothetical protein